MIGEESTQPLTSTTLLSKRKEGERMQNITLIIAIGVLTEALIEYAREVTKQPILGASIAIGIALVFLFDVRLFELLGMATNKYADLVLTGIIAS